MLVIPTVTKRPPAVVSTQWYKYLSKVPGLKLNTPDRSADYLGTLVVQFNIQRNAVLIS